MALKEKEFSDTVLKRNLAVIVRIIYDKYGIYH